MLAIGDAIKEDICTELGDDFDRRRFIPYIAMHEFEGMLFSDPIRFAQSIGKSELSASFQEIRNQFDTPEEINDSPLTAPSKRIGALFPGYQKPLMGQLASTDIGLDVIRRECPIFGTWIDQLEERA